MAQGQGGSAAGGGGGVRLVGGAARSGGGVWLVSGSEAQGRAARGGGVVGLVAARGWGGPGVVVSRRRRCVAASADTLPRTPEAARQCRCRGRPTRPAADRRPAVTRAHGGHTRAYGTRAHACTTGLTR